LRLLQREEAVFDAKQLSWSIVIGFLALLAQHTLYG
jgi:hypothetical protein